MGKGGPGFDGACGMQQMALTLALHIRHLLDVKAAHNTFAQLATVYCSEKSRAVFAERTLASKAMQKGMPPNGKGAGMGPMPMSHWAKMKVSKGPKTQAVALLSLLNLVS